MNFDLSAEQKEIQAIARDFARTEILPITDVMDETHEFPYEVWRKFSKLGMAGIRIPQEYGGAGLDTLTYILALEEIATVSNTFALIWQVHVLVSDMYMRFGSKEQQQEWLPTFAAGERLAAFALTEPAAGSDAAGMTTRAVERDEEWIINGTKIFISNAGTEISDGMVLMAVSGERPNGKKEISSFIVPRNSPGFVLGQAFNKIGWHGMDNRELVFNDCRIPKANLLGTRGAGLRQALTALDLGRIAFGAVSTGLIRACLEASLAYAKQRVQFGQPISKFQLIQAKLADMATTAEASRRLTHYAAFQHAQGRSCHLEGAMAKLFGTTMSTVAASEAFQVHGGYGFMKEFAVNRYYREARILEVGEGSSEIQRLFIARELGC